MNCCFSIRLIYNPWFWLKLSLVLIIHNPTSIFLINHIFSNPLYISNDMEPMPWFQIKLQSLALMISVERKYQQNFDTHVKFCHTSKEKSGSADIRLLLTKIGRSEQEQREENLEDWVVRFDINSIRPRHPSTVYTLEVRRKGLALM